MEKKEEKEKEKEKKKEEEEDEIFSLKILFIHGGGSGVGRDLTKTPVPHFLTKHFKHFHCEHMVQTSLFSECINQQARAIQSFEPDIVIGKSQGGPILVQLLKKNYWAGPCITICAAHVPEIDNLEILNNIALVQCNGKDDIYVPLSSADALVDKNRLKSNKIRSHIITAEHSMLPLTDKTHTPNLIDLIKEVWELKNELENYDHSKRIPPTSLPSFFLTPPASFPSSSSSSSSSYSSSLLLVGVIVVVFGAMVYFNGTK